VVRLVRRRDFAAEFVDVLRSSTQVHLAQGAIRRRGPDTRNGGAARGDAVAAAQPRGGTAPVVAHTGSVVGRPRCFAGLGVPAVSLDYSPAGAAHHHGGGVRPRGPLCTLRNRAKRRSRPPGSRVRSDGWADRSRAARGTRAVGERVARAEDAAGPGAGRAWADSISPGSNPAASGSRRGGAGRPIAVSLQNLSSAQAGFAGLASE